MPSDQPSSLLQLLTHPTRRTIIRIVIEHDGPCSPVELSRAINQPLANVGYHVRQLVAADALSLSRTEPVAGEIKHFYVLGPLVEDNRTMVDTILSAD